MYMTISKQVPINILTVDKLSTKLKKISNSKPGLFLNY